MSGGGRIWSWVVVAIVAAALIGGWVYREQLRTVWSEVVGGDAGDGRGRPPPLVETAQAERATISERISATGTLTPPERVTVAAQTAGRIASIHFEEGDAVRKDQVLVILERERAEAAVEEAAARVEQQSRELERRRTLGQRDFVSKSEIDRAEADAEAARAALRIATEELANLVVEAPFSGVLGRRLVSPGAFVEPGAPIAELTRVRSLDLLFDVPGKAVGQVELGQTVEATTPAFPELTFTGQVTFVGTQVSEATRTLPVEATFDNEAGRLKPGMYLRAELIVGERQVVRVPEAAVVTEGPNTLVYVVSESDGDRGPGDMPAGAGPADGPDRPTDAAPGAERGPSLTVGRRPVETGVRREGWIAIRDGLESGERVVVAGLQGLRDGMTVRTGPPPGTDQGPRGGPPTEQRPPSGQSAGATASQDGEEASRGPRTSAPSGTTGDDG
jgi:membrane fusion protein (multidrug efflux system)